MNDSDFTTTTPEWNVSNTTDSIGINLAREKFFTAMLVCKALSIVVLVLSIWIFLCMIIHGCKTKKQIKKPGSSSIDRRVMYSCCAAAVALSLPRILFTCVLLMLPTETLSPVCEIMMDTSNGLYVCATYPAYLFLWLRQKAIYCHPAAKQLAGKCVVVSGWIVLLVLTVFSAGLASVFIAPLSYTSNAAGCVIDTKAVDDRVMWYYVLAGLFISAQLSLLALFIYPMVRCGLDKIENRRQSSCALQATPQGGKVPEPGKRISHSFQSCRKLLSGHGKNEADRVSSLSRTIRRSVYSTLVAIFSDFVIMALVSFAIAKTTPRPVTDALYDLSILINSLCILATFGGNRKILSACWSSTDETSANSRKSQDSAQANCVQSGSARATDNTGDWVAA